MLLWLAQLQLPRPVAARQQRQVCAQPQPPVRQRPAACGLCGCRRRRLCCMAGGCGCAAAAAAAASALGAAVCALDAAATATAGRRERRQPGGQLRQKTVNVRVVNLTDRQQYSTARCDAAPIFCSGRYAVVPLTPVEAGAPLPPACRAATRGSRVPKPQMRCRDWCHQPPREG